MTQLLTFFLVLYFCSFSLAQEKESNPVLIVLSGSKANHAVVNLSLPPQCEGDVAVKVTKKVSPEWISTLTVLSGDLTLSPGGKGEIELFFDVKDGTKKDTGGKLILNLVFTGTKPEPTETKYTVEVPLLVDEPPTIESGFTTADQGGIKPRFALTIISKTVLKVDTLKATLKNVDFPFNDVVASEGGKELAAYHDFEESLIPGLYEIEVQVTGENGVVYKMGTQFTYIAAIRILDYKIEDTGGRPENEKANSEEQLTLAVEVESLEPSLINDIRITCPVTEPLLKPTSDVEWVLSSLQPGVTKWSSGMEMEVGRISAPGKVAMECPTAVGGIAQDYPLDLAVEIFPSLELEVVLSDEVQDPEADGVVNNNDGMANTGESVVLVLTVENEGVESSPLWDMKLSSRELRLLKLGKSEFSGNPVLASGRSKEFKVPVTIGKELERGKTVVIDCEIRPADDKKGVLKSELLLAIEVPPLELALAPPPVIKDPDTGELAGKNNNNGILGNGERGYIYLKVRNEGPPLTEVYFTLEGPQSLKDGIMQSKADAVKFTKEKPVVECMFEVTMPVDYREKKLMLKLYASARGKTWEEEFDLDVEYKSDFEVDLVLLGKDGEHAVSEDVVPGAKLGYLLEVTCSQEGGTDKAGLSLQSIQERVKLAAPKEFSGQTYKEHDPKIYKGSLTIPEKVDWDAFSIVVNIRDETRADNVLFEKSFGFNLGAQKTDVLVTPTLVPKSGGKWKIDFEVVDRNREPVKEGVVLASLDVTGLEPGLELSTNRIELTGGKGELYWMLPDGFVGQILVKIEYLGDKEQPKDKDVLYLPSYTNVTVPPVLGERTDVQVVAKRTGKPEENRFEFHIIIVQIDKGNKPVGEGVLKVNSDLGEFIKGGITGNTGEIKVGGSELVLIWEGTSDPEEKGTAVFSYLGDRSDPDKVDEIYTASTAEYDLPPLPPLKKTEIQVAKSMIGDWSDNLYELKINVVDDEGNALSEGALVISSKTGRLSGLNMNAKGGMIELNGNELALTWQGPADMDQGGKITFHYMGDRIDPDLDDRIYATSNHQLTILSQIDEIDIDLLAEEITAELDALREEEDIADMELDVLLKLIKEELDKIYAEEGDSDKQEEIDRDALKKRVVDRVKEAPPIVKETDEETKGLVEVQEGLQKGKSYSADGTLYAEYTYYAYSKGNQQMTLREFWIEVRKYIPDVDDRYVTVIGKKNGEMMDNPPSSDNDNATDLTIRGKYPLFENIRFSDEVTLLGFETVSTVVIIFPFSEMQLRLSDIWVLRIVHGPFKYFSSEGIEEFRCVHGKRQSVKR